MIQESLFQEKQEERGERVWVDVLYDYELPDLKWNGVCYKSRVSLAEAPLLIEEIKKQKFVGVKHVYSEPHLEIRRRKIYKERDEHDRKEAL